MSILASVLILQLFQSAGPAASTAPSPEDLRQQIRVLRHGLLTGGELVRGAESEAQQFYQKKIQDIDHRMDSITADLADVRASYEVTLEKILGSATEAAGLERGAALTGASGLLAAIEGLEAERETLRARRTGFMKAIRIIKVRSRERERLALQLETSPVADLPSFILPSVGLAPAPIQRPNPLLDDTGLVQDLVHKDPVRAKRLLFEVMPEVYWARWPLSPPAKVLSRALPFPQPDMPGRR